MKKITLLFLLISLHALAQLNSVYNASTYAYTTQVTSGNSSTGSSSIMANPTAFAQGIPFLPYNLNASITINRNAATAETITPSAIANCYPNSLTCTLSGTFSFKHISGDSIQSGTFGLQEAVNIAVAAGSGTVLIDASWGGPTGASLITAAKGSTAVLIQDNRNPAGATFYQWNGSAYAATGGSGGVPSVFGRTGAITATTGDYSCAQVTGCATSALQSINGDTTAAQHIAGSGGITCTTTAGTTTCNYAGSAGSGTVGTGAQYQISFYPSSGSNTVVGPHTGLYAVPNGLSSAQMNTFVASITAGTASAFIPDGFAGRPFTNTNGLSLPDFAKGMNYMQLSSIGGIACDERQIIVALTSGSNQVSGGGQFLSSDVGRTLVAGGTYSGTQFRFMPTITAVNTGTGVATLSTTAPFTDGVAVPVFVGTMNTANIQQAMTTMGFLFPAIVPANCTMLTNTLSWNAGQSFLGQHMTTSVFQGVPGADILQTPDAAGQGGATLEGLRLENVGFHIAAQIDASHHFTDVTANGTTSTVNALYRPIETQSPNNNNPLAPGWAIGSINGVASTTQNSAVICYSTASGQVAPVAGQQLVFRDFTAGVYVATVSSLSGSGCTGVTSPATLSALLPNTSGYTQSQIEWVSTSSVQTSTTALGGTITYPVTITLANPIAPSPIAISNFAAQGRLKAGSQEFYYAGVNYSNNQIVLRSGPTACSGVTCSTGFAITPENPCEADWEVPWPVVPTINTGDSTPHGANYFPALCGGNAAISFPQANGNVFVGTGLSSGFVTNVEFGNFPTASPTNYQLKNNTIGIYFAGNNSPYSSHFSGIRGDYTQYGIIAGPASYGMHGVLSVGPTSAGNTFSDLSIHAGYPLMFSDLQQSRIDRADTYSTIFSQFDGSVVGTATCIAMTYTLDEQTGGFVTSTGQDQVNEWNCEPEGGNNEWLPTFSDLQCFTCKYTSDTFEGDYNVIDGEYQTFDSATFLAGTSGFPVINYGENNRFLGTQNTAIGFVSNTFGLSSFLNWGLLSDCGAWAGGGPGPITPCGISNMPGYSGRTAESENVGNMTHPFVNAVGGFILPGEWNSNGSLDSQPMTTASTLDTTEPYWNRYTSCNIGTGLTCAPTHFDGFNGFIYIGPLNRIVDAPYLLNFDYLTPGGANSFFLTIRTFNPATGTGCSGGAQVFQAQFTTSSSWQQATVPVDFTGQAGCILGVTFNNGASSGSLHVGKFNFIPAPLKVQGPISAPTEGGSCPASSSWLGAFSGFTYFCDGGTVKRVAII